ncbi:MAG TPA: hypothetical protein VIX38_02830 [Nitrososphaeraceae archaeon]
MGSPTTNRRQLTFKRAESNEPHPENKKIITLVNYGVGFVHQHGNKKMG